MGYISEVWALGGKLLTIVLLVVILNEIFRILPEAARILPIPTIEQTILLLVPTGIGVLWSIFSDDGF